MEPIEVGYLAEHLEDGRLIVADEAEAAEETRCAREDRRLGPKAFFALRTLCLWAWRMEEILTARLGHEAKLLGPGQTWR
jgi:hypothetical protein